MYDENDIQMKWAETQRSYLINKYIPHGFYNIRIEDKVVIKWKPTREVIEREREEFVLETQEFLSELTGKPMTREEPVEAMEVIAEFIGTFAKTTSPPGSKKRSGG